MRYYDNSVPSGVGTMRLTFTTRELIMQTPWGPSQSTERIADGVFWYSTASHGGFFLSQERRRAMPEPYRSAKPFAGAGWYEEDCDWAVVVCAFPVLFPADHVERAKQFWELYHAPKLAMRA